MLTFSMPVVRLSLSKHFDSIFMSKSFGAPLPVASVTARVMAVNRIDLISRSVTRWARMQVSSSRDGWENSTPRFSVEAQPCPIARNKEIAADRRV
jgi:hypothetical protein